MTDHAPPPGSCDDEMALVLHDVRNWLAIALAWLDDVAFGEVPWRRRQDAARLAVDRAAALIDSETDRLLERRASSTIATVREAVAVTAARLGPAVEVACSLEADLPELRIAPGSLQRIVLNLLLNAARAMGPRGGRIRIDAEAETGRLHLHFRDEGPGIPDPEAVFRAGWTGTGGRGLGLASAWGLAETAGGRLEVIPHAGVGAWLRLTLPTV